ncbi:benzoate/H(+) symporter BenE family transporter [Streptomyces sp. NBC_00624]|uniref:benzoate/H(+) symporter BenE family transporter n=1 Tax=Streptomyces sp. NBC_00624 TaxID=2975791 RepID=UPI003868D420
MTWCPPCRPLFVVTMDSQNLPGVAVLRGSGYEVPVSPVLTWTGAVQAVLAPFGAFGINLAAMTAAICTGDGATIEASLASALSDPASREAAVVTFLATASGVTLLGIGSAFWGLLAGVLTSVIAAVGRRRRAAASPPAPAPQPVTAASRTPERTSA